MAILESVRDWLIFIVTLLGMVLIGFCGGLAFLMMIIFCADFAVLIWGHANETVSFVYSVFGGL